MVALRSLENVQEEAKSLTAAPSVDRALKSYLFQCSRVTVANLWRKEWIECLKKDTLN